MDKAASKALLQALRTHRVELETELLEKYLQLSPEQLGGLSAELRHTHDLIMIIIRRIRSSG